MTTEFMITQSEDGDFYLHKDGWQYQDAITKEKLLFALELWIDEHSEEIA